MGTLDWLGGKRNDDKYAELSVAGMRELADRQAPEIVHELSRIIWCSVKKAFTKATRGTP